MLLHVVDASGLSGRDPVGGSRPRPGRGAPLRARRSLERPQLVAATQARPGRGGRIRSRRSSRRRPQLGLEVVPVSAATGRGLLALKRRLLGADRREPRRGAAGGARVRIGLYGGTFDPIHLGHLRAAETAREGLGLDLVAFLPAAVPPHRDAPVSCRGRGPSGRWLASPPRRTRGSRPGTPSCGGRGRATPWRRSPPCVSERPSDSFVLVVGADTWPEMASWREPRAAAVARRRGGGGSPGLRRRRAAGAPFPGARGVTPRRGSVAPDLRHRDPGARRAGAGACGTSCRTRWPTTFSSGGSTRDAAGDGRSRGARRPRQEGRGRGGARPALLDRLHRLLPAALGAEPAPAGGDRGRRARRAARHGPPPGPRRGLPAPGVDPARLLELRRPRHDAPHAGFYDLERLWGGAKRLEVTG